MDFYNANKIWVDSSPNPCDILSHKGIWNINNTKTWDVNFPPVFFFLHAVIMLTENKCLPVTINTYYWQS